MTAWVKRKPLQGWLPAQRSGLPGTVPEVTLSSPRNTFNSLDDASRLIPSFPC